MRPPRLQRRILAMLLVAVAPAWLAAASLLIFVVRGLATVDAAYTPLAWGGILLSLIAIPATMTIAWQRLIIHPLTALERGAESLASGRADFSVQGQGVPVELQRAAEAYDRMADEVQRTRLNLERKILERTIELQERNKQLEAATRYKTEFLANMSHEIRTPLNAVIGMATVLADMQLPSAQRNAVETIRLSGQHLLTVISDILDISRIEAGRLELVHEAMSIRQMVEEAAAVTASGAMRKGLEVIVDIHPEVPSGMTGDAVRLRQILVNLIDNAVKFTDRGHIHVEATMDGDQICFSVTDTGIGVPPERVDELFTAFHQLDPEVGRRVGGTGLGLTICHRLVELMGGTMSFAPNEGGGSLFRFTVPCPKADAPEQPLRLDERVLIVDDHPLQVRALERMIRHWGAEATVVMDIASMFDHLQSHDVVLLDAKLPGLDADELLEAQPRVVFLGRPPGQIHAPYVTKPLRSMALHDAIDEALGRPPASTVAAFDKELARKQPLKILVVEDSLVNQKVAQAMLARYGYQADVAMGGGDALDMTDHTRYDLVFMDIEMPGMNGLDATRRLRQRGCQAYICAMTAHVSQADRDRCKEAGMDDYLPKPVRADGLGQVLTKAWHARPRATL